MASILVLNVGSSSIKFAVFDGVDAPQNVRLAVQGHLAQAGAELEWQVKDATSTVLAYSRSPATQLLFDHAAAFVQLSAWLDAQRDTLKIVAVGQRVVHGGPNYVQPVRVTPEVLAGLEELIPLAPLHQPYNLQAIRIVQAHWPNIPQVACFDTAFHATQSALAQAFALPRQITAAGVRRYGFHGLSYEYIATQLPQVLGSVACGKVIVAHLGNGASLCALHNCQSVASSMGFSALDGLMMGTRCGSLDPGVILYLLQQQQMSVQALSDLLYTQSGLLGVSGISSDMRVLLESTDAHALEAIALFVQRIVCEIGALAALLGGLDALVFTAGIGEHAAPIRARVADACAWLGARLDADLNARGGPLIHAADSRLQLAVVPTDEEKMIAIHTLATLL